jgi:hypothetical protein
MPRKRSAWRVKAEDGLDQVIEIGPPPFRRHDVPAQILNPRGRLQLDDLVTWWTTAAAAVPPDVVPAPFSREAYARSIVTRLSTLERFKHEHPEYACVLFAAIAVGYEMADAFWRLNRGTVTRSGKNQRAKAPRAGKLSAAARRRLQTIRRDQVGEEARRLRAAHPKRDKLSTRQLAQRTSAALGLSFETVYRDLRALKIT